MGVRCSCPTHPRRNLLAPTPTTTLLNNSTGRLSPLSTLVRETRRARCHPSSIRQVLGAARPLHHTQVPSQGWVQMPAQRADQLPATLLPPLPCRPSITMAIPNTGLDRAVVHSLQAPCRLRVRGHLKDDLLSPVQWLYQVPHRVRATSAYGAVAVIHRRYLPTRPHSMTLATMAGQ